MGLFDKLEANNLEDAKPLAARMRPRSLAEFAGQKHFLGDGKLLRRILETDRLSSASSLHGPPGCGKTSLAELIATQTKSVFAARLNAASASVKGSPGPFSRLELATGWLPTELGHFVR